MASHLPSLSPIILFLFAFFFLSHSAASHNYKDALSKSILFFEGQRSGKLPPNHRMTWRGDSALSDGSNAHVRVDLVGGYYDAGDNVKFTFPMAFTTTMLSWNVLEFGGLMKGELQNVKEAIRWATDYLLKATAHPNTIYVQVGEAKSDHACWERPEDMDTPRNVYKIDQNAPGTKVAAETAAALAAASLVFRKSDRTYSNLLLKRAKTVYKFADKHSGSDSKSKLTSLICPFYCKFSGHEDEMLWGATWLHKATKNSMYLNFIHTNRKLFDSVHDEAVDYTFGWENKHFGAKILLSQSFKALGVNGTKSQADKYVCSLIPGTSSSSQSHYTPGGLLFKKGGRNTQYVTSTSFLLLTYAKHLKSANMTVSCGGITYSPRTLRTIAKKQVDYLLGSNPLKMSFMVGYGPKFPQRVHHRGSSLPSIKAHPQKIHCSAGFSFMKTHTPNPNLLVGAVVGGPDQYDRFPDLRPDSEHSEPSTYINAPLVGSLAYLAHLSGQL